MNKAIPFLCILLLIVNSNCQSTSNRKIITEKDIKIALDNLTLRLKAVYISDNVALKKRKIAVLPLRNEDGNKSQLGLLSANIIQESIFDQKYFSLLERERIDSILNEHEFQNSGMVDNDYIKAIGNKLGAELVVIGTISQSTINEKSYYTFSVRMVDVSTGEILSIANTNVLFNVMLVDKYNGIISDIIEGIYMISLYSFHIESKKSSGQAWDADGSAPDIQIVIKSNQTVLSTNVYYDVYDYTSPDSKIPFFNGNINLSKDDNLVIAVWDRDLLVNDSIGQLTIPYKDFLSLTHGKKTLKVGQSTIELSITKVSK